MKVLVAVDLQNDFINGALAPPKRPPCCRAERKIRPFEGLVLFTRDTHTEDYLNTREGQGTAGPPTASAAATAGSWPPGCCPTPARSLISPPLAAPPWESACAP